MNKLKAKDEIRVIRHPEPARNNPAFAILPLPHKIVLREEGRKGN